MGLLEKPRDPPLKHIILDTPGQIEIFTWSASGQIVTELLASGFPTLIWWVRCVLTALRVSVRALAWKHLQLGVA